VKSEEAQEIHRLLCALYDIHPERASDNASAWTVALEQLDAEDAMVIVGAYIGGDGPDRLPAVPVFVRSVCEVTDRRHEEEQRHDRTLRTREAEAPGRQPWLAVWGQLRADGNTTTVLPEQQLGYEQLGLDWPGGMEILAGEEYERLIAQARELVKAQPAPVRVLVLDPDCTICEDQGLVQVGYTVTRRRSDTKLELRRGQEEVAPCVCERGQKIEHPGERAGPWGSRGFWNGQEWKLVRPGVVSVG
jgi:hypothetical protein